MTLCPQHKPFKEAARVWHEQRSGSDPKFDEILVWCVAYGFAHSDEHTFMLARPWKRGTHLWEDEKPYDTWFIWLAATDDVKRCVKLAPHPLPYVSFYRRGKEKCYNWTRLINKIYG